jgi:glutamate/tyrosine decarboxylase-like PLP-dependent enzyme
MPEAWFLGPKAENADVLFSLVVQAIERHCSYRRSFHPEDPAYITDGLRQSKEYRDAVAGFGDLARALFDELRHSAPFSSMRYQGHMLWDQALPAIVGYIGALLYNQNNVAAEASPVTTMLEGEVGDQLCKMLGYKTSGVIQPWGHITCDGSVANIESLWAARNAKYFPIALREAIRNEPSLKPARGLKIQKPDTTSEELVCSDDWTLLNVPVDSVVNLPERIEVEYGIDVATTTDALKRYTVQNIGLAEFHRRLRADINTPVVIASATRHYSWPKAATLLGLGQCSLRSIQIDEDARVDLRKLDDELARCLEEKQPVIAVVAVIGSTEEGAVDPLGAIIELRNRYRSQNLDFVVHCDAAWGGYFNTIRRDLDRTTTRPNATLVPKIGNERGFGFLDRLVAEQGEAPSLPLSSYVDEQLACLGYADSITVDPHKAGYVPYPAGALCYRNSAMRDLISLGSPVVFHSGDLEPTVGIYGVEGSKPGAAAAAAWLAHKVIPLSQQGYGKILGQCVWTSKRTFCRLLTMHQRDPDARYRVTFVQRLPSERSGMREQIDDEIRYIAEKFVHPSNADLLDLLTQDSAARSLFSELGSDLTILAYTFNFKKKSDDSWSWNTDSKKLAALNTKIFEICSIMKPTEDVNSKALIVTSSEFDRASCGDEFMRQYCERLKIDFPPHGPIPFLISTTMDPWTTDTPQGDFLELIEHAMRAAVHEAIAAVDP